MPLFKVCRQQPGMCVLMFTLMWLLLTDFGCMHLNWFEVSELRPPNSDGHQQCQPLWKGLQYILGHCQQANLTMDVVEPCQCSIWVLRQVLRTRSVNVVPLVVNGCYGSVVYTAAAICHLAHVLNLSPPQSTGTKHSPYMHYTGTLYPHNRRPVNNMW